jgi:PIN domain nuclease of toxin-antitoxin system
MRGLLDTHALLWFIGGDERLGAEARRFIEDGSNEILVSSCSLWEIAIKHSLGKLQLETSFAELFPVELERNAMAVLGIGTDHLTRLIELPFHHRDPFDRLLIAQALVEDVPILGSDSMFDAYGVNRMW